MFQCRLCQADQQHLTVDGHSWSQLSLFGPFGFWITGANKTFLEQELQRSRGCKPAKRVRFCTQEYCWSQIQHCIVFTSDQLTVTSLFSFGKLINRLIYSSIEEGVRQRQGDGCTHKILLGRHYLHNAPP